LRLKHIFLITGFILILYFGYGQHGISDDSPIINDPYTRFYHFNATLGPDAGTVIDIFQDKFGFIWFGSTNGLYCFDGVGVYRYFSDWTPGSLPDSYVSAVVQDSFGRLLVCSARGLCGFAYRENKFYNIIVADSSLTDPDSLNFESAYVDGDSLLWINAANGWLWKLRQFDWKVLDQYPHMPTTQPYYFYQKINRDHLGRLVFGGRGMGPYFLDQKKNELYLLPLADIYTRNTRGAADLAFKRINNEMAYYFCDRSGNTWMGASDGIFNMVAGDSIALLFLKTSSWAIAENKQGVLFFGTSEGLLQYNPVTHEKTLYEPNEEGEYSLPGPYIVDIFADSYDKIWISTVDGVAVFKPWPEGIKPYFHIPGMEQTLSSSIITDLVKDEYGKIWIATANKGVNAFNREDGTFVHYNPKNVTGMISGKVRCLLPGKNNMLYCGLWAGKGFGRLNISGRNFDLFTYNKNNTHFDWYNDMVFDSSGILYLGFWGGNGLTPFDTSKMEFLPHLRSKFSDVNNARLITCLNADSNNNIWVGTTQGGLHVYLPVKDTAISYHTNTDTVNGIEEDKIYCVYTDRNNNIWVGAAGVFVKEVNKQEFYKVKLNGFNNIKVYRIFQHESSIWMLTSKGLLSLNMQQGILNDYSKKVPLVFDEISAEIIETDSETLMLGGKNGLLLFDPAKVNLEREKPMVFISYVKVFDNIKKLGLVYNDTLTLKYNENFFSLSVGTDAWFESDPYRYYYKLEDFNADWSELKPGDRIANFTNVPAGDYVFRVKLVDQSGREYSDITRCFIRIIPPFYQQWWFFTAIIIIILSSVYVLWRNRLKNMKLLLDNAALNQKLLRLQMNPHFIFNSLFAIQNFIYTNQKHLAGNYLSDFAYLIRLILNNSRFDYIPVSKEKETLEIYLKLQQMRFENRFNYELNFENELLNDDFMIPPMLAQPFLENAIEHGIKHSKIHGMIVLTYKLSGDYINLVITDNGIGLTASGRLNENTEHRHESLAISICRQRLDILRLRGAKNTKFNIEEIFDENGKVKGTKVELKVPYRFAN